MTLTDALNQAQTKHVVYFLLTAYVESLGWYAAARSSLPAPVMRLPVREMTDVFRRLDALRRLLRRHVHEPPGMRDVIEEAVEIFGAATRRLSLLARPGAS